MNSSAARLGACAAAVAALAAFLPWATVSVQLLGVRFSGVHRARGIDVGSIAGLSYGWAMVVLAIATLLAFQRPSVWLVAIGGLTGVVGLYATLEAVHHVVLVPVVDSQYVNALLQPHITRAYGLYLEALASVTVVVSATVAYRASRAAATAEQATPRPFPLN